MADADQAWSEFSTLMATSRQQVDELLRSAGASWEGLAAESARDGVTPLLQWADDAGTAGQASGVGLRQLIDAFAHTASAMPEPVEVIPSGFPENYVHLFGGLTDQDRQTRLAHEAKRRAVELMESYSTNAHSALSGLGKFVPPQAVTVRLGQARQADQAYEVIVTGPAADDRETANTGSLPEPQPAHNGDRATARTDDPTIRRAPDGHDGEPAATYAAETVTSADPAAEAAGRPDSRGLVGSSNGLAREGRLSGLPAPVPVPGAGPGGGGRHDGGAERGAGARFAARRMGAAGMGPAMVPATATRPDREEDREHTSPAYLVTDHDDVWGEGRVLGPPVVGDEGTHEG